MQKTIPDSNQSLPVFTEEDLLPHSGISPMLSIYLGLDGYVYDMSSGREYYGTGGRYHYLACKDSSFLLRIMGSGIIKLKYPVNASR